MAGEFTTERLRELLLARPLCATSWAEACSPFVHVRIGNADAATSREDALAQLTALFDRVEIFGRAYCDVRQSRNTIFVETDALFRDRQGEWRVIPCAVIARTRGSILLDLRFYLDPRPVPGIGSRFRLNIHDNDASPRGNRDESSAPTASSRPRHRSPVP